MNFHKEFKGQSSCEPGVPTGNAFREAPEVHAPTNFAALFCTPAYTPGAKGRLLSVNLPAILILFETAPYLTCLPLSGARPIVHTLCLLLLALPRLKSLRQLPTPYCWLLAWSAVAALRSPLPAKAIVEFSNYLLMLAILCDVSTSIHEVSDLGRAGWRIFAALAALVCVNVTALPFDSAWGTDGRFMGWMVGPNYIGGLMLVTVGVGLWLWPELTRRQCFAAAGVMALACALNVFADSRTPVLALSLGVAAWLTVTYRLAGKFAACGILCLLFVLKASQSPLINRGMEDFNGRIGLWSYELQKIADNPLVGYGSGIEATYLTNDRYLPDWYLASNDSFQNGYLSLAMELGVPALALWFYAFLAPWPSFYRRSPSFRRAIIFVLLPLAVDALSESTLTVVAGLDGVVVYLLWLMAWQAREAPAPQKTAPPMFDWLLTAR